ncbi:HEAT repeat domain-containing protein [Planctomycetaceae bacterium SH139]
MRSVTKKSTLLSLLSTRCLIACSLLIAAGCHDGPMYALKQANPFFSMHQWPAAERLGPTDHQRAEELRTLVDRVEDMPPREQQRWMAELAKLMEHDDSPHMRGLAAQAAGKAQVSEALPIIRTALDDDDFKVRMIAARALETRREPAATEMLVAAVNSEANKDVRLAAIKSLGNHRGEPVTDALKLALQEPELAYRHTSIASLRQITGKDAGDSPEAWVAMLETGSTDAETEQQPTGWGARLRSLF